MTNLPDWPRRMPAPLAAAYLGVAVAYVSREAE